MENTQSSGGTASPTQGTAGSAESSGPPTDGFRAFLVGLATDPAKLGTFIKDPDGAMQAAGISSVDQSILKSGDPVAIHSRLGRPPATPKPPVTVLIVNMVSPSDDQSDAAAEPFVRAAPAIPLVMAQGLASASQAIPLIMSQAPSTPSRSVPLVFPHAVSALAPPLVWPHAFASLPGTIPLWPTHPLYGAAPPPLVHPQIHYPQCHSPLYAISYPQFYPHPYQYFYPQFFPFPLPTTSTEQR